MKNSIRHLNLSKHTFLVERTIFSNTFPELKENRLRIYLLLCRVVGVNNKGLCFMSIKTICNEVNLSEHYVKICIDWLARNYFIEKVKSPNRSNAYRVLISPDYHKATKQYFSNGHMLRNRYDMKNDLNGYCEIPVDVMKGSILRNQTDWTDRKIKALGQLYLFHWIAEYGGVDPKVVEYRNTRPVINELMYHTIGCSKHELSKCFIWLLRKGLLIKVKTVYRKNKFSCMNELQYIGDLSVSNALPTDEIIEVLRLTIIPDMKLNDALVKTGGKIQS
ncbi:hypothetical protein [Bacillus sp. FJAT-22090]|uniref:hypothetical protein n=1 Tax=Bacillus sp. FJAT-22090 TaxID=1581038 RepID=UPI0011A4192D|nr:hypothetical protein [Bacillus sp. FJAT-22090]